MEPGVGASIGDRPCVSPAEVALAGRLLHALRKRRGWSCGRGIHGGIGGALHAVSEAQKSLLKLLQLLLEELILLQEPLYTGLC